ncbi:hypothetical protein M409DRAFT_64012 [Zasmidium cellare ATCC 36951]|uniref:NAD(P)-binding domain-containing protein n=1 Tax=Zasmidium cellare ATCC 36951 TaxID=1080233 RepID=A0A6A6CV83_ZASCE|nr:uncharacterized protein M409DRAFT_64012 [Zasmidium cellare ATCC 36951]KAF2171021.1 hypothetical protein M409DRAFT_64012 [Zasmidium cellare ATCC 36951]
MSTTPRVIVFGPTGNTASVASTTAHSLGAQVYLAMRDPSKPIQGLNDSDEKSGNYTRLQADLTQPATVLAAVQQSHATRAFIYAARGSTDHMKGTIQALKDGGVEYVVFLSSFTVTDPASSVPPAELIGHQHAQIEVSLEDVYGKENFCAIRPGGFATNSLQWKSGILAGKLEILGQDFKMDCITPGDMGRVSGNVLVKGSNEHAVYLYGPENLPCKEIAVRIARVLGKGELEVGPQSEEDAAEEMTKAGYPPPVVQYMVKARTREDLVRPLLEQGVENVEKFTGRKAMGLEEWVEGNRGLFV